MLCLAATSSVVITAPFLVCLLLSLCPLGLGHNGVTPIKMGGVWMAHTSATLGTTTWTPRISWTAALSFPSIPVDLAHMDHERERAVYDTVEDPVHSIAPLVADPAVLAHMSVAQPRRKCYVYPEQCTQDSERPLSMYRKIPKKFLNKLGTP
jgi:hypothetical protein